MKQFSMILFKSGERNKINGSLSFVEDVKNFDIVSWITVNDRFGKRTNLFNVTVDGCRILENVNNNFNPILGSILQTIKKFVYNLPPRCPVKKNRTLTVSNYFYDEDMLPPYLPVGSFTPFFGIITKDVYAYKIFLTARVEDKSGRGRH
ncbi:uncharacterized protein LOC142224604 [Haematobia irritans]|uniref:uncharacterized protein LOC142224604 n=1 Tax=Haematobia irritans TaxID=7368 RepID=UPI003F4F60BC